MTLSPTDAKLQRWVDLLAELLTHRYGLTLEQLRQRIPGYDSESTPDAVARMFERDKNELRNMGIPIETIDGAEDLEHEAQRYRVDPREMYLPFLTIASAAAKHSAHDPRRLRTGYRSIPSLSFEPDELDAIVRGAHFAMTLDEPAIVDDTTSALRKLACDFPIDVGLVDQDRDSSLVPPREKGTAEPLRILGQALLRQKRVSFTYHSITRDTHESRSAEPYGLFFASGHWYMAARDINAADVRNFRVSRMRDVAINTKRPQSSDYSIPHSFRLSEHANSKSAWEIGDGDAVDMVVEFRGASGASSAAMRLGAPHEQRENARVFRVRRLDVFARWVISFAGDAVAVSPPALIERCREIARETLAGYRGH